MVTSLVMSFGRSIRLGEHRVVWAQILRAAQDTTGKGKALETTLFMAGTNTEEGWRFSVDLWIFQDNCNCHAELRAKHLAELTPGWFGHRTFEPLRMTPEKTREVLLMAAQ